MFRRLIYPKDVTDQEARWLAEPAVLATVVFCLMLIATGFSDVLEGSQDYLPITLGVIGVIYSIGLFYIVVVSPKQLIRYKWPIAVINASMIAIGLKYLPQNSHIIPHLIMVMIVVIMTILWGRTSSYVFLALVGIFQFFTIYPVRNVLEFIVNHLGLLLIAIIVTETISRLIDTNMNRIRRLEKINDFTRQISSTLEAERVISLVSQAIQDAIKADTYFLGIVEGEQLDIRLIYDDGESFPPSKLDLKGTLSGWVIRHQESLFIPDLTDDVDLEGVQLVLLGQDKTSLCWMGVPMRTTFVNGVIAIASYKPNDFDRTDLELLEILAHQTALALDNAHELEVVEAQSRLDSLTGAYNHGYFVTRLNEDAQKAIENKTSLALIMLDIDYFKQYNDNFGHMVGDQVLQTLTQTIREHIKVTDATGRWGGEEFAISLPDVNGKTAMQIAERIKATAHSLSVLDRDGKPLPFPTVSQGIAVFPDEAHEVDLLIDLADQRLYIAKARGRDQIEPSNAHWERIQH